MTAGTERKQCLKPRRSFHFDYEKSRGIVFYKQKEMVIAGIMMGGTSETDIITQ